MAKLLEKWLNEVPTLSRGFLSLTHTSCSCAHSSKRCCFMCFAKQHNSQLPKNYKEKEAFKQFLREGSRGRFTPTFADRLWGINSVRLLINLRRSRYSEGWEWRSRRRRKLWRSHSARQYGSEPHQGVRSQTIDWSQLPYWELLINQTVIYFRSLLWWKTSSIVTNVTI